MLQADGSFHTSIPGSSRRIDARRAGPGPVGRATARDVDSGTNDVLPGPRSGSRPIFGPKRIASAKIPPLGEGRWENEEAGSLPPAGHVVTPAIETP